MENILGKENTKEMVHEAKGNKHRIVELVNNA